MRTSVVTSRRGMRARLAAPVLAAMALLAGCNGDLDVETVDNLAALALGQVESPFCCRIPDGEEAQLIGSVDIDPAEDLAGEDTSPTWWGLAINDVTPAAVLEFRWDGWFVATGHEQPPTAIPDPSHPPDGTLFDPGSDVGGFADPHLVFPGNLPTPEPHTLHVYATSCGFGEASFTLSVFTYKVVAQVGDDPVVQVLKRQLRRVTIVNDPELCDGPPVDAAPIVFSRAASFGPGDIRTTDLAGSGIMLTNDDFNDLDPAWSPDHTRIAFSSNRHAPGFHEVYVMDADGGNAERASMFETMWVEDPSWSPDGQRIAVSVSAPGQPDKDIWVLDLTQPLASRASRLTEGPAGDASPTWSPDGQEIAFVRSPGDILVVPADGSAAPAPLVEGLLASEVDWSSQGEIAFARYIPASIQYRIWRANGDGTNPRAVTGAGAHYADRSPSWSPLGDRIAFVRHQMNSEVPEGAIRVADPDGSNDGPVPGQQQDNSDPDW